MKKAVLISAILIGAFGFGFANAYSNNFDSYATGTSLNGMDNFSVSGTIYAPYVWASSSNSSPNSAFFEYIAGVQTPTIAYHLGTSTSFVVSFWAKGSGGGIFLSNTDNYYEGVGYPINYIAGLGEDSGNWDFYEITIINHQTWATKELYINSIFQGTSTLTGYNTTSDFYIKFLQTGNSNYLDDFETSEIECSTYTNYPSADWPVENKAAGCNYDTLVNGETTDHYKERCEWVYGANYCKEIGQNPTTGQLDEIDVIVDTPINCINNSYDNSWGEIHIPVEGRFWNNTDYNFGPLYVTFYDNDNGSTTFQLAASSTAQTNTSYATTVTLDITSHQIFRLEYWATGTDYRSTITLKRPLCCTTVGLTGQASSTSLCNLGTDLYSGCSFAYQNCLEEAATATFPYSIIANAQCTFVGAFWSLFCPDPEALNKAQAIVGDIGNRFPITLVKAFQQTISFISTSSLASSTATTSLITMDLSWSDKLNQIAILSTVRNWLVYILWVLIGIGILIYTQKHFFNR